MVKNRSRVKSKSKKVSFNGNIFYRGEGKS